MDYQMCSAPARNYEMDIWHSWTFPCYSGQKRKGFSELICPINNKVEKINISRNIDNKDMEVSVVVRLCSYI